MKTKALISFVVTVKLICGLVFAYANCWFSHEVAHFNMAYDLQQGKKTEISTKISQVKNGVTDFTAHIEAMRSTRDLKLADIERIQKELQVKKIIGNKK